MAKGLLVVLGLVLVLVAGLAVYRTWRQHEAAEALAIRTPNGIAQAGFIRVNGVEQWVSIRGEDRSNPVLVLLHGGPGVAFLPVGYKALRSWEKDFTVVQWDQPGAGRTFSRHGTTGSGALTLDRIAADGIGVVEHARKTLGKDKVVLVGVSWGSVVGVEMSRRRPDLIHTYVGAGQVVDMQRNEAVGFDALLQKVRAKGDAKAETKLLAIGAPPYAGRKELLAERKILEANPPESERGLYRSLIPILLFAPDYGLKDIRAWLDAGKFSIGKMLPALMTYSDDVPAPVIPVPVVFLQGEEDIQTPTVLVKSYFERLQAPSKRLVLIPGGGHSAVIAMPDIFLRELKAHVRPSTVAAETP
ncbi:MAG: alpha/beta hydrolase [Pseudomonadota bacterium]|nr:alpha/beta hydrolase [Phenylobacterium sp.]MBT9473709.1 alpha/beta hydrolase [Phenylobacterium sp.]